MTLTRVALAALFMVVVPTLDPAEAGGVKFVIKVGPSSQVVVGAPSRVIVAPPSRVVVNAPSQIIVRTPPVVAFPIYAPAPQRCHVPGYWTYTWVPQSYASNVWVDGQYAAEGVWIAGHWAPRVYYSGSYQPYWIPERWSDC